MEGNICYIPVSIGELIDKYTILQIKQTNIKDKKKVENVEKELFYLKQFIDTYKLDESLMRELKETNEILWNVEDKIREKEKEHKFDEEFVKLARNVYITNDKRSEIKNKINLKLKSGLHEVKSYSKYNNNDNNTETINIDISNTPSSVPFHSQSKLEHEILKPVTPDIHITPVTKPIVKTKTKTKSQQIDELNKQIDSLSNTFNYNELIDCYKKILELDPQNAIKYLRIIGETYEKQNMLESAIEYYEKVLKIEKYDLSIIGVLNNQIGICYHNLNKHELAIQYFKKVLLIKELTDVYCNISMCYIALKNYRQAEFFLLKSYNLDKNDVKTNDSLGHLYYYIKKYDKSIDHYKKTNANDTNHEHKYNLSFSYLSKKDFKTGFTLYENRLKDNKINKQTKLKERVDIPGLKYWNGKDLCNKLLVVYEQGIGDNILYYRFIIELSEKYPNMKIDYFCRAEIAKLFKTYKNIQIVESVNLPDYDYTVFIMSLPKILNLSSIEPNKVNYINTKKDKLLYWNQKTSSLKKFKVGFVYNGLLSSFIDKYIPLQEFEKLCDLDINLICIHRKSEVEKDLKNIKFRDKITHYDIDNGDPFEDTIHLLQNIDLLITVDTYIAHLAGVLNVKTWLLLGTSEWRWSDDKNKTYWYNSVELVRTKENEELKDLIKTVKNKLLTVLESYTPNRIINIDEDTSENRSSDLDEDTSENHDVFDEDAITNMTVETFLNSKGFYAFEGHTQLCPQKVIDLINLTNKPHINIMEIGFNAGHSAEIFLQNNKNLTLTSFDLGGHTYVSTAKEYIDATYPNRHTLILGDSRKTIPYYLKNNKDVKFDFIFIDGGHEYEIAKTDIENCFHLAHKDTIVALDDTMFTKKWEQHYTDGPTRVWTEYLQENKIIELNRKDYSHGLGMSWGKYIM
jgi:ADP-heptose:LPS heptosyltransferase/predicted O-methyltransferase YrrM/Tfp pilus assembly protein PilF